MSYEEMNPNTNIFQSNSEEAVAAHEEAEEIHANSKCETLAEDEASETKETVGVCRMGTTTEEISQVTKDRENDERDFELFRSLPFVDLINESKKVDESVKELESIKSMMDQIGDISNETYSALVGQMDLESRAQMGTSIKEFYKTYPDTKHEAERIKALVTMCVDAFGDEPKHSPAFMMMSMMESVSRRIKSMENAETIPINAAPVLKRLRIIEEIYQHPVRFNMIFHKLRFPTNTIKLYREFKDIGPDAAMKYIDKVFSKVFDDKYMKTFRHTFRDIIMPYMDKDYNPGAIDVMIFFLTFWLAKQYEKENNSGKAAEIRAFVMDVYFAEKYGSAEDHYDLPGGREYLISTCMALFMLLTASCSDALNMKNATSEIQALWDSVMESLGRDYVNLKQAYPGKDIFGTSIEIYFGITSLDEMKDHISKLKEENTMETLQNQNTSNPVNVDIGQASVDSEVMPDEVNNMDDEACGCADPDSQGCGCCADGVCDIPEVTATPTAGKSC